MAGMTNRPSDFASPAPASTRRDFLRTAAAAALGAAVLPAVSRAADRFGGAYEIIGFSKPFQHLSPAATADFVRQVGWSGIEIPVRRDGQIDPSQARDLLPRFTDAFQSVGLDIPVVVSDITSLRQESAEGVLRVAARLGIKRVRLGQMTYDLSRPILPQVDRIAADLREIGQLCHDLNIEAGVENHSGSPRFGAPVWDIVEAIRENTRNIGIFFDIGHATVEGGLSWPIQAALANPLIRCVYVKDFFWHREASSWQPEWCPLGDGMVDPGFFKTLRASGYAGPICQHHEYPLGNPNEMLDHMRKDLATLQGWLGQVPSSPFR